MHVRDELDRFRGTRDLGERRRSISASLTDESVRCEWDQLS